MFTFPELKLDSATVGGILNLCTVFLVKSAKHGMLVKEVHFSHSCSNKFIPHCIDPAHEWIQRGDRGPDPPPPPTHTMENYKNIGFLRNTGREPLENNKAIMPAFNAGP